MHAKLLISLSLTTTMMWAQPQVVATGLQLPQKIILTPQGNLLVSETSVTPNSGRISLVTRAGVRQSLFENLPSGLEVTGGASGPTAMALRDRTLYFCLGGGDAERRGTAPGTSIHNPEGYSSPIFSSVLAARLDNDVDAITAPFRMTTEHQRTLTDGGEATISNGSATARVTLLARFPVSEPHPTAIHKFSNPWGLALTEDGQGLYVADASFNSVARVNTATGQWQRIVRFPPVPNPSAPVGPPVVDPVPTSVRLYGNQLLVSFLTGFPFAPGNARVLAVNPEARTFEPFIFSLTSATDVLWRTRAGSDRPQFFVLEFSTNQSAQPVPPGRLLRFDTAAPTVAASGLIAPVSMAYDASTQDLYILELRGQILRLRLD